jgi:Holliday junction resolvase
MTRINSRKKGAKNERNLCKVLQEWAKYEFTRTPASGGLRWKKTDNITGDIVCAEPNVIFPFTIESKAYKEINFEHLLYLKDTTIESFWAQAKTDSERGKKIPILMMRYDRLPKDFYFVVLSIQDFNKFKKHLDLTHPYAKYVKHKLVVMHSDVLLKSNYKKLEKVALSLISERWPRK